MRDPSSGTHLSVITEGGTSLQGRGSSSLTSTPSRLANVRSASRQGPVTGAGMTSSPHVAPVEDVDRLFWSNVPETSERVGSTLLSHRNGSGPYTDFVRGNRSDSMVETLDASLKGSKAAGVAAAAAAPWGSPLEQPRANSGRPPSSAPLAKLPSGVSMASESFGRESELMLTPPSPTRPTAAAAASSASRLLNWDLPGPLPAVSPRDLPRSPSDTTASKGPEESGVASSATIAAMTTPASSSWEPNPAFSTNSSLTSTPLPLRVSLTGMIEADDRSNALEASTASVNMRSESVTSSSPNGDPTLPIPSSFMAPSLGRATGAAGASSPLRTPTLVPRQQRQAEATAAQGRFPGGRSLIASDGRPEIQPFEEPQDGGLQLGLPPSQVPATPPGASYVGPSLLTMTSLEAIAASLGLPEAEPVSRASSGAATMIVHSSRGGTPTPAGRTASGTPVSPWDVLSLEGSRDGGRRSASPPPPDSDRRSSMDKISLSGYLGGGESLERRQRDQHTRSSSAFSASSGANAAAAAVKTSRLPHSAVPPHHASDPAPPAWPGSSATTTEALPHAEPSLAPALGGPAGGGGEYERGSEGPPTSGALRQRQELSLTFAFDSAPGIEISERVTAGGGGPVSPRYESPRRTTSASSLMLSPQQQRQQQGLGDSAVEAPEQSPLLAHLPSVGRTPGKGTSGAHRRGQSLDSHEAALALAAASEAETLAQETTDAFPSEATFANSDRSVAIILRER